jgi:hypothetical protein
MKRRDQRFREPLRPVVRQFRTAGKFADVANTGLVDTGRKKAIDEVAALG